MELGGGAIQLFSRGKMILIEQLPLLRPPALLPTPHPRRATEPILAPLAALVAGVCQQGGWLCVT